MIKIATFFQLSKYPGCYTRGTCGRDNRDETSIAGTNDTTIIFNHSILVQHISGISLAGVYSRDRKSTAHVCCHDFKQDRLNTCSWIPKTVTESKTPIKACPSVDGGNQEEFINLLALAKKFAVLSPVNEVPAQLRVA